jgi:hypothetical protein
MRSEIMEAVPRISVEEAVDRKCTSCIREEGTVKITIGETVLYLCDKCNDLLVDGLIASAGDVRALDNEAENKHMTLFALAPQAKEIMSNVHAENDKVRAWCNNNGFTCGWIDLSVTRVPDHLYKNDQVQVEACFTTTAFQPVSLSKSASTTPAESIICKVKVATSDWLPARSFEEFINAMRVFRDQGYWA